MPDRPLVLVDAACFALLAFMASHRGACCRTQAAPALTACLTYGGTPAAAGRLAQKLTDIILEGVETAEPGEDGAVFWEVLEAWQHSVRAAQPAKIAASPELSQAMAKILMNDAQALPVRAFAADFFCAHHCWAADGSLSWLEPSKAAATVVHVLLGELNKQEDNLHSFIDGRSRKAIREQLLGFLAQPAILHALHSVEEPVLREVGLALQECYTHDKLPLLGTCLTIINHYSERAKQDVLSKFGRINVNLCTAAIKMIAGQLSSKPVGAKVLAATQAAWDEFASVLRVQPAWCCSLAAGYVELCWLSRAGLSEQVLMHQLRLLAPELPSSDAAVAVALPCAHALGCTASVYWRVPLYGLQDTLADILGSMTNTYLALSRGCACPHEHHVLMRRALANVAAGILAHEPFGANLCLSTRARVEEHLASIWRLSLDLHKAQVLNSEEAVWPPLALFKLVGRQGLRRLGGPALLQHTSSLLAKQELRWGDMPCLYMAALRAECMRPPRELPKVPKAKAPSGPQPGVASDTPPCATDDRSKRAALADAAMASLRKEEGGSTKTEQVASKATSKGKSRRRKQQQLKRSMRGATVELPAPAASPAADADSAAATAPHSAHRASSASPTGTASLVPSGSPGARQADGTPVCSSGAVEVKAGSARGAPCECCAAECSSPAAALRMPATGVHATTAGAVAASARAAAASDHNVPAASCPATPPLSTPPDAVDCCGSTQSGSQPLTTGVSDACPTRASSDAASPHSSSSPHGCEADANLLARLLSQLLPEEASHDQGKPAESLCQLRPDSCVLPVLPARQSGQAPPAASASTPDTACAALVSLQETLCCPITHELFADPVIAADGFTYERQAIENWLGSHDTSPITNLVLPYKALLPNLVVRTAATNLARLEPVL